jgi:hypothetical protein
LIGTNPAPSLITRKANVTLTATVGAAVAKIDFYVNSILTCTDTTADASGVYSCPWKVPNAAGRTYSLTAKATDALGQVSPSSTAIVISPK